MSISIDIDCPLENLVKKRLVKLRREEESLLQEATEEQFMRKRQLLKRGVPDNIRRADYRRYEPRAVSIGPNYYYLREDRLREMEDHKWRLLGSFVRRNDELDVKTFIYELQLLEQKVRGFYGDPIDLSSDNLVLMLLLDGCYILELFFKWQRKDPDVLFAEGRGPTTIFSDLILYENQIPFFVIQRLHDMTMSEAEGSNRNAFLSLLVKFLLDEEPWEPPRVTWPEKMPHLHDLFHQYLIRSCRKEQSDHDATAIPLSVQWLIRCIAGSPKLSNPERPSRRIPCATDLFNEVGVRCRKRPSPKNLFDVEFKGGILEIPPLEINSDTKAFLTNLVALEKDEAWEDQIVSSYLALMDSLIKRKEDVVLLQRASVIDNLLPTDEEAIDFIRKLRDTTRLDPRNHHFFELFKQVQGYYNSRWKRQRAMLIHDYCKSPWAIVSVIAGVILLGLTTLQTFYTVYPYYRPN